MSGAVTNLSREELQAAFMNLSVTEVREIHDRIATYGGAQCVFLEMQDPQTGDTGMLLSSARRVWLYATNDGIEENPIPMLVIWNNDDCLSVRR